jgi:hypothetical protein
MRAQLLEALLQTENGLKTTAGLPDDLLFIIFEYAGHCGISRNRRSSYFMVWS